ncbi:MAG: ubiquitin-like domain-containing protein [Actinomycetales bacterium]
MRPALSGVAARGSTHIPVPPRGFLRGLGGRRPVRLAVQGGALLGVVAGTVAFTSFDKSVVLTVDGHTSSVHAFGTSVHDVLADKGITVGPHDLVSPSPSARVQDGEHLVVRFGRPLTIDLDGQRRLYWTTALTVDQALAQLGLRDVDGALSVSRDASLGRRGLSLSLTTPKEVVVTVDGRRVEQVTTAATVGVLLQQLGITLGPEDTVSVPLSAPLEPGLALAVTRIVTDRQIVTRRIKMPVTSKGLSSLAKGKVRIVHKGHPGTQLVTYELIYENGRLVSKDAILVIIVKPAVRQTQRVGTKSAATGTAGTTGASGDPGTPGGGAASLNWAALAQCESGGNPRAVNPNGYYGLYQFSLSTWHSVGGTGNPIDASSAEQTHRAMILYNKAGAGQWTCGSHLFD